MGEGTEWQLFWSGVKSQGYKCLATVESTGPEFLGSSQYQKDLLALVEGKYIKVKVQPQEEEIKRINRLFQDPGHAVLTSGPSSDSSILLVWILESLIDAPAKT